ncbi:MAG: ribosome small subunit-dependent GTPase A [Lachnospiraceae bacterium]|nr:ribosome small subunit-dependent GTPase A [Lachnospiraceae bacterium]
MRGKIIKGIGGFYYVHTELGLYECKAKGIFRKDKIKPLVGDNVEIDVLDEEKKLGSIVTILPRLNSLIRPAVANIDQAVVIFAMARPEPNLNLLDRFLVMMQRQGIPTRICFNKLDIAEGEMPETLKGVYEKCENELLFVSSLQESGIDILRERLHGKTTVLAGPSGVGKSSVVNKLFPAANAETGLVSEKIGRGKHTTRHSELFYLEEDTFIMDTPGFSSLAVPNMEKEELKDYFSEFAEQEGMCRFQGCVHINEPGCRIKELVAAGKLSESRYRNYMQMYGELNERKRY